MEITITLDTDALTSSQLSSLAILLGARQESSPLNEPAEMEISEEQIDELCELMYAKGLEYELPFRTPEIYNRAMGDRDEWPTWPDLPTTARRTLGKRFKKLVEDMIEEADDADDVVSLIGKTIQNAAIYQVKVKADITDR